MILYVGGSPLVGCDPGVAVIIFCLRSKSLSRSGQTKSLETSIETPNCMQGRSKTASGNAVGQVVLKSVGWSTTIIMSMTRAKGVASLSARRPGPTLFFPARLTFFSMTRKFRKTL